MLVMNVMVLNITNKNHFQN